MVIFEIAKSELEAKETNMNMFLKTFGGGDNY